MTYARLTSIAFLAVAIAGCAKHGSAADDHSGHALATAPASSSSRDSTSPATGARALPIERENEWTRGLVARDPKVFDRLLAPGFVYTEDSGVMTRDDVIASATGEDTTTWAGNEDMKVHDFGDTQLVTGVLHVKGHSKGAPFDRRYAFTDTWQNRGGTWQLIGAQRKIGPKGER